MGMKYTTTVAGSLSGSAGGAGNLPVAPNVIDIQTAPPGAPNDGDRYIVQTPGSGAWTGQDENIAEWNGASWDFTTEEPGTLVFVENQSEVYIFLAGNWVEFDATVDLSVGTTQIDNGNAFALLYEDGATTLQNNSDLTYDPSNSLLQILANGGNNTLQISADFQQWFMDNTATGANSLLNFSQVSGNDGGGEEYTLNSGSLTCINGAGATGGSLDMNTGGTGVRTYTLPDKDGTVAMLSDIGGGTVSPWTIEFGACRAPGGAGDGDFGTGVFLTLDKEYYLFISALNTAPVAVDSTLAQLTINEISPMLTNQQQGYPTAIPTSMAQLFDIIDINGDNYQRLPAIDGPAAVGAALISGQGINPGAIGLNVGCVYQHAPGQESRLFYDTAAGDFKFSYRGVAASDGVLYMILSRPAR
jgi:hypothetical protein